MITREDGKVLASRFQVCDGVSSPRYEACARADERPNDPDRGRNLEPGEKYQRLSGNGHPIVYEGRFWVPATAIED